MTQQTTQARANAILAQIEQKYARRMPGNFREIAVSAIVTAMVEVQVTADNTPDHQSATFLRYSQPVNSTGLNIAHRVLNRPLFKSADVVAALLQGNPALAHHEAQRRAARMVTQFSRRGLIVPAGTRGYWQASRAVATIPEQAADQGSAQAEADQLRKALIKAASNFHLIALHGDMQSMHRDAKAGRDEALNAMVTVA